MMTLKERAAYERDRQYRKMLKSPSRMPWPKAESKDPEPPFEAEAKEYLKFFNGRRTGVK